MEQEQMINLFIVISDSESVKLFEVNLKSMKVKATLS